ncbi:hypothetical protein FA95DRAFT_1467802, partial [Auriscalpium vulgare]
VNSSRNDWARWLPVLVHAYNGAVHSSTGYSPSFLLFGFEPRGALDLLNPGTPYVARPTLSNESAADFVVELDVHRRHARDAIALAQDKQARSYNRGRRTEIFEPGDQVLMD